jgi:hypothetical protein
MIRDIQDSSSTPVSDSLSVQDNQEVEKIFQYIDFSIGNFHDYYMNLGDSEKENRITDLLIACFEQYLSSFNNGYFSIRFSKNPTEKNSAREPDIGIYPRKIKKTFKPIVVLEAKRLYDSSHSIEYVSGGTGGIERFKRCLHAADDNACGMIGYVQIHNFDYWFTKINNRIEGLAKENIDKMIDWTHEKEKLTPMNTFTKVQKYSSSNYRKAKDDFIQIFHYFVELL